MKRITQIVLCVLVVCVLVIALYLGVWWLRRENTDRQARVNQRTYGRQNALVEQILDDIAEAENPAIPAAQRVAIVDIVCDSAAKLTGSIALPPNAARFIEQECM